MALDPRKRQKKLERKRAKERKTLAVARSRPAIDPIARSAAAPIHECFRGADLWEQGIGWVVISRRLSNGQIAYAAFLVDVFCLGVKDVHCDVVGPLVYEETVVGHLSRVTPFIEVSPPDARKLVEDAVVYANGLGILPHADYRKAQMIFGDIDAGESHEQYTFGKDGKPFFISGPHDTPEKCRRIMAALHSACGYGNFDLAVHFSPFELASILPRPPLDADAEARQEDTASDG